MLCKPHRGKTIRTTGQQSDHYVDERDPVGKVRPNKTQHRNTDNQVKQVKIMTINTIDPGVKHHITGKENLN